MKLQIKCTNFFLKQIVAVVTEQLETKMEKVFCNDKANEVVKEESEESCDLTIPF